jgi:hypothetical protein
MVTMPGPFSSRQQVVNDGRGFPIVGHRALQRGRTGRQCLIRPAFGTGGDCRVDSDVHVRGL